MVEEMEDRSEISVEFRVKLKDIIRMAKNPKYFFPEWAKDEEVLVCVVFKDVFDRGGKIPVSISLYENGAVSAEHARQFSLHFKHHFLLRHEFPAMFDKLLRISEEKLDLAKGWKRRSFCKTR